MHFENENLLVFKQFFFSGANAVANFDKVNSLRQLAKRINREAVCAMENQFSPTIYDLARSIEYSELNFLLRIALVLYLDNIIERIRANK